MPKYGPRKPPGAFEFSNLLQRAGEDMIIQSYSICLRALEGRKKQDLYIQ